jgi:DNA-directed RNA polymerase subunit beta
MSLRVAHKLRLRRNFGKINKIVDIPNLIEIQRRSYDEFLQLAFQAAERRDVGLQGVFRSVFPIKDFNETASLEFVSYALGEPKYSVKECHERGMTFAAPLKVTIQLVIWDVDPESGENLEKLVTKTMNQPADVIARVKKLLGN